MLSSNAIREHVLVIGVTGGKGTGKNTFATAMEHIYRGTPMYEVALADTLKEAASAIFGGAHENYWGTQDQKEQPAPYWAEKLGPGYATYRKILQQFGTNVVRSWNPAIWCLAAEQKIAKVVEEHREVGSKLIVLITDIRFDDEAAWVRNRWGGMVVETVKTTLAKQYTGEHATEEGIDPNLIEFQVVAKDREQVYQAAYTLPLPEPFNSLKQPVKDKAWVR